MRKLFQIGLLLSVSLIPAGAIAQDAQDSKNLEVGLGVICDTAEQIQRYMILYKDGTPTAAAMQVVNTESKSPAACGLAAVAFLPGKNVGNINVSGGIMRLLQITVVAMRAESDWRYVKPTRQFIALFEKLDEA
jgi:hypothetical protein